MTLTERGRDVVAASYRPRDEARPQAFYAGIAKQRELAHDVRVHQAYREAADAYRRRAVTSVASCSS